MYSMILIFVILLNTLASNEAKLEPLVPSESYTHKTVADEANPNQYVLLWKLLNNEIQFEVHCKTTGWVGLGISPNGGMKGADIAIGWVKDNTTYLKDCYATDKVRPLIDEKQDLTLLDGAEINGYTILKFKRRFETCDVEKDVDIQVGTNFLIFAWQSSDPATGNNDWSYHGATNRFTQSLMLRDYKKESLDEQNTLPNNAVSYDFRMNNLAVPAKDTYYHCQLFQLPAFPRTQHLIQFEMLVNSAYKQNVHHLLVYECEDSYVPKTYPFSQECGSVPLNEDVFKNCSYKMIVAWGIGGKYVYSFPSDVGYPFAQSTKAKYILVEMHYDNPKKLNTIRDNSGVRLYFTPTLRKHNLGLLTLGSDAHPLALQVPPNIDSLTMTTICHPDCTQKFFPKDGITVLAGFLHTHLLGTSVSTSIVRNNVQIKDLFSNPNYDFNYQYIMDIEPVKIYQGDALITKCKYSSKDRNQFTFFGVSTNEEMCFNFMYYYPKIDDLNLCLSAVAPNPLFSFYRSLMKDGLAPQKNLPENPNQNEFFSLQADIATYLQTKITYNATVLDRFKKFFEGTQNKSYTCVGSDFSKLLFKANDFDYTPSKILTQPSTCGSDTLHKFMTVSLLACILVNLKNMFY